MDALKVLIVDDSLLFREVLHVGLKNRLPMGSQIEKAGDPFEARDKILSFDPDVMILDVEMPNMNGIEFLRRLIVQYNLPTIVSSSRSIYKELAMRAGAFSFLEKPSSTLKSREYMDNVAEDIKKALRMEKRLIAEEREKERRERVELSQLDDLVRRADADAVNRTASYRVVGDAKAAKPLPTISQIAKPKVPVPSTQVELIAIGASTGGTEALSKILKELRPPLPPIVIVQHIPPMFSRLFSERLNNECVLGVKEAENGDRLINNHVYIAPGDKQMMVKRLGDTFQLDVNYGAKVNGHCPSVDVLFNSVAERVGIKAMGIILTGMGEDGARGLLKMREAGSVTLGQDEASCVVYGMPRAAYEKGAVAQQLPLSAMAAMITSVARFQGGSS